MKSTQEMEMIDARPFRTEVSEATLKLEKLIPDEEYRLKTHYGDSELEPNFLCFDDAYSVISELLPKHMTIVDLGCYQAAQCYFFKDFEAYIGVDNYDLNYKSKEYTPPLRFAAYNTEHYVMSIQDFMNRYEWTYGMDADTYFIMSAVPNMAYEVLEGNCENYFWWYPGKKPMAKGIMSTEILNAFMERYNDF